MSRHRPDWFNPNNPAYKIRQAQLRSNGRGFSAYSGSFYSSSNHGCGNYNLFDSSGLKQKPIKQTLEEYVTSMPQKDREQFDKFFDTDFENESVSLTFDAILAIKEFAETRERNLRNMFSC